MKTTSMIIPSHYLPILALACGLWWAIAPAACSESKAQETSDEKRRQKIERMYEGYRKSFSDIGDIEPVRAIEMLKTEKVIFIDERKPEEQAVSMLPNSVTAEEFLRDPSRYDGYTRIGYCTISYRSGKLARRLKKRGIQIYNLRGGILAWVHDGGTIFDRNGPTRRIHVYSPKWNLAPEAYEAVW